MSRTIWQAGLGRAFTTWVVVPAFLIFVIVEAATGLPTTIGAALGHGTHGTFTAVQYTQTRSSGYWTGTFTPANHGLAIQGVTTDDLSGLRSGSIVPALYNGGQVFAAHSSMEWLYNLLILIVGAVGLVGWCWRVPLSYRRQRGSITPPPWSLATRQDTRAWTPR